jgi:hypothetical protein
MLFVFLSLTSLLKEESPRSLVRDQKDETRISENTRHIIE